MYRKQAAVESARTDNLIISVYDKCEVFRSKMRYSPFEKYTHALTKSFIAEKQNCAFFLQSDYTTFWTVEITKRPSYHNVAPSVLHYPVRQKKSLYINTPVIKGESKKPRKCKFKE